MTVAHAAAIALLALGVLPRAELMQHTNDLLSAMGERTAGNGMKLFVSIDAVIVLAGAVLTSYVVRSGQLALVSLRLGGGGGSLGGWRAVGWSLEAVRESRTA